VPLQDYPIAWISWFYPHTLEMAVINTWLLRGSARVLMPRGAGGDCCDSSGGLCERRYSNFTVALRPWVALGLSSPAICSPTQVKGLVLEIVVFFGKLIGVIWVLYAPALRQGQQWRTTLPISWSPRRRPVVPIFGSSMWFSGVKAGGGACALDHPRGKPQVGQRRFATAKPLGRHTIAAENS